MTKSEIIGFLKEQYPRDTRKLLIKKLLDAERDNQPEELIRIEKLIDQIFSYILKAWMDHSPKRKRVGWYGTGSNERELPANRAQSVVQKI